ncbi:MAG: transglutaminase-like domain-containing protein [Promethearchaeota archaeon]
MNFKTKIALIFALITFSAGIGSIYYIVLLEKKTDNVNKAPVISNLPDQQLEKGSTRLDAFDLDDYTNDPDSDLLFYSIIGNTNSLCGVNIDSENKIDIIPDSEWIGVSNITIQASDGKLNATDVFMINVTGPEDPGLEPPPFPFDEDFWQDLFDQIDPEEIPTLLDMLSEMFDGDIDDLDLGNYSQGLLDLLYTSAGEMEVFRVYDYLDFSNMSDVLWKYESFDQYTGDGWESTASSNLYSFFRYSDYIAKYFPDPELLKIKMPISPKNGLNSMVLPSLFPTPNIMENSVSAPNLISNSTTLYKTDFNSSTLDFYCSSDENVNITYEMFGLHLPSASEINSMAVDPIYTPPPILTHYLQLPPDINTYKANNPYFINHYNILDTIISDVDNAFEIANKIRMYLQTNFSFPMNKEDYTSAPEGRDVVDWFCETQQGLWSDFASAFCAFTRVFGVASRYVNGFNSRMIEEFYDPNEDRFGFAIKYKNMYSWAEIFVPTDVFGNGNWVQIDIFDSMRELELYNISISIDKITVNRPDVINITATISSAFGAPIDNNTILFRDLTSGQEIGSRITNSSGIASILYNINNSHVVGPHLIEARYDSIYVNFSLITILGNIGINLTIVNPQVVNRSDLLPDIINVQGSLYDPLNGNPLQDAIVDIVLFQFGTSTRIINPFNPSLTVTNSNGNFNENLNVDPSVSVGQYEIRADFNGTWIIYEIPIYIPIFSVSSNRIELNIII